MTSYIIRRLLLVIPTLILVTIIVFLTVRIIPGTALDLIVEQILVQSSLQDPEAALQALKHALGLDAPVYIQYGRWLGFLPGPDVGFSGILQGDFGSSLWRQMPIRAEIAQKIPVSFELGFIAMITALIIAVPIGIYSAVRQDTIGDYIGRSIAILGIALPSFWVGTMVIVYPSIWWGWTPPLTYIPIVMDPVENLKQFIVPGVILAMVMSGTTMRMTRTMMLEVLRQDYIRTAWAKGLTERTVIMRHALKNALIPVVTIVGMQVPILIGGSVVLEQIFALPGIGRYMVVAIQQRDYPVISAINVIVASLVLIANLVVDLTYAWLDPRVKYG